jgi:hypothetical protein
MSQPKPKVASPGSILLDVAILAWCSYRLWQGTSGWGWKVLFIVVIVISGLSLFGKLMRRGVGAGEDDRSTAENIHNLQKGMYAGPHEYRDADDAELRGLDPAFYERTTVALRQLGFRVVGQIVDVTAERVTPWARGVVRCLLDTGGTVTAGVYNVKLRGWYRLFQIFGALSRDLRTIDLETELSDGQFVTTSTAGDAALASEFTGVHRRFYPKDVGVADLVERHREHVTEAVAACAQGVHPVALRNFRDVRASQERLQVLKSAHRASPDFDPGEEVERIARGPMTDQERRVAEHVRELHRREQRDG